MQTDQDILLFATHLAKQAGAIITDYFYNSDRSDVENKSDSTPLTEADTRINQLLIDGVRAQFPEHGVMGEELSYEAGRSQLWVCDPIDGTNSLIAGIPVALFSLAYVVDGDPQVAVMFDPFQNALFSATKGSGAFCNGQPVHVTKQAALQGATIGITSGYKQVQERRQTFDALVAQGASPLIVPGNVFKSGLVARGNIDGYIFPGRSAHDIAAAALIIAEAGGRVTDLDGGPQRYDGKIRGAIISNGLIHNSLVEAVKATGSEQFLGY